MHRLHNLARSELQNGKPQTLSLRHPEHLKAAGHPPKPRVIAAHPCP